MSSENTVFRSNGYRWREELIQELLKYIKDEIPPWFPNKRALLNNLLRKYVPGFFPARTRSTKDSFNKKGKWLFPASWGGLKKDWWEKQIEDIGKEFAEEDGLDYKLAKKIFEKHHWKVEEPVEGISLYAKSGRWFYDAYKDKVAVEVELSKRIHVFKDAFKFLIGQAMGQIDVGIIMVRKHLEKKGQPYFEHVDRDMSHAIYTTLPMLNVVFYGFPNKPSRT